jgi:hypothetical protein
MRLTWIVLAALLLMGSAQAQGTAPAPLKLQLPPAEAPACAAAGPGGPIACGQPPPVLTRTRAALPQAAPPLGPGRPWLQELIRGTVCTIANARYCAARDIPDYSTVRRVPDAHQAG